MDDTSQPSASADEGPAHSALRCLTLVARHHGLDVTLDRLVKDFGPSSDEATSNQLVTLAQASGLRAKAVTLDWDGLTKIAKTFPAVMKLKNGNAMLLVDVGENPKLSWAKLRDPMSPGELELVVDRHRLEEAWSGEVVLFSRSYAISDETKPFSAHLVASLVFRERRIVRDVVICAAILSLLALTPVIFFRLMSDRVFQSHSISTFIVICLGMAVLTAFDVVFAAIRRYLVLHLTTRIDIKLSTYIFDKVLSLPIDFFERNPIGLIAFKLSESNKIRLFLTGQMFGSVLDLGILLVFLPVMAFFSPILTAIVLICCVAIFTWIVLMMPLMRRRLSVVVAAESARSSFMIQTLQGIRTVKSLALDARQRKLWDGLNRRAAMARIAEGRTSNMVQTVVAPLEKLMVSGTFAYGVYLATANDDPISVGGLLAFLLLSQRVATPLIQAAKLVSQLDDARIAIQVVSNVVNQPAEEGRSGHGVKTPLQGHLEFSKVQFSYKGSTRRALNDVTFNIAQGTTLGVMGRSGSGKTTITRLLQRLHSDYRGSIKIDGLDIRDYDIDHLRSSLGVVLQDNYLFTGTIKENITIAKPNATYDEMVAAARLGGAQEFIDKLPRGYETYIFEGSPNLSGGQRQRLAIARALITDPKLLILDEATSALDAESEAIVNANIESIANGRTMLVISHRLSSLVRCDAIMVLDQGTVHDIGTHEELLGRCEIYSSLWNQQHQHQQGASRAAQIRPKLAYRGPRI
ncbi:peptidase domain-containing ABC transporter [Lichenihabitans psoromatis]|uniref:peptidase domain-containing ABC transporter n=1 Tax=Lichenihabitans psoromatis TaxID=2528642 RepID=UPI0010384354|nr:peptidase domain-containing ABC transporter [Lichenihabitans psoromatis]